MIKVLVADDEVNVVKLICNLVDWQLFGMEIVAVAHNGVEALELIEKHMPDVVVTDIRMPGYDGMEMIERAKRVNEGIDFIVISGYRHFDYAQKAIRFGVHDYLLKPIKKEELSQTLQKIAERRAGRARGERRELGRDDLERLRFALFTELISNRGTGLTLETVNKNYHYGFSPGVFQFLIIKLDYPLELLNPDAVYELLERIRMRARRILSPECADMELYSTGCRIYGILNYDGAAGAAVRRQLKIAADELGVMENIRVTFGLGEAVEDISGLEDSMLSSERASAQRLFENRTLIEGVEEARDIPVSYRELEEAADVLDAEALSKAVSELLSPYADGGAMLAASLNICRAAITRLKRHNTMLDELESRCEDFSARADLCRSAGELASLLSDSVAAALEVVLDSLRQAEKKPVRMAKQYIQENYRSQITLEEVAAHVGFAPSYFSTLFKKESGRNFLEYLSEARMNKARDLLKETNMTVASVCEAVGYSDIKHFTKSFKKHTGLRPAEYRRIFS